MDYRSVMDIVNGPQYSLYYQRPSNNYYRHAASDPFYVSDSDISKLSDTFLKIASKLSDRELRNQELRVAAAKANEEYEKKKKQEQEALSMQKYYQQQGAIAQQKVNKLNEELAMLLNNDD